jgi:hypothetical protein
MISQNGNEVRYSLLTLLLFVAAVCLVLAFPRYFLLVTVLFTTVNAVLVLVGAFIGLVRAMDWQDLWARRVDEAE